MEVASTPPRVHTCTVASYDDRAQRNGMPNAPSEQRDLDRRFFLAPRAHKQDGGAGRHILV